MVVHTSFCITVVIQKMKKHTRTGRSPLCWSGDQQPITSQYEWKVDLMHYVEQYHFMNIDLETHAYASNRFLRDNISYIWRKVYVKTTMYAFFLQLIDYVRKYIVKNSWVMKQNCTCIAKKKCVSYCYESHQFINS